VVAQNFLNFPAKIQIVTSFKNSKIQIFWAGKVRKFPNFLFLFFTSEILLRDTFFRQIFTSENGRLGTLIY